MIEFCPNLVAGFCLTLLVLSNDKKKQSAKANFFINHVSLLKGQNIQ